MYSVLAPALGNLPEVQVWNAKTVLFSFRSIYNPNPLCPGTPNMYPYPSACGFC